MLAVDRLDEITGIGHNTTQVIIAEIGLDMSRFPKHAHLVSWAKLTPRTIGFPVVRAVPGDGARAAQWTAHSIFSLPPIR